MFNKLKAKLFSMFNGISMLLVTNLDTRYQYNVNTIIVSDQLVLPRIAGLTALI